MARLSPEATVAVSASRLRQAERTVSKPGSTGAAGSTIGLDTPEQATSTCGLETPEQATIDGSLAGAAASRAAARTAA